MHASAAQPRSPTAMTELVITTEDGRTLTAEWLSAPGDSEARATLLVAPATGVRRTFYAAFSAHLAELGYNVLLWDARGIGDSRDGHIRHDKTCMFDWGRYDLDAMIRYASTKAPQQKMILLGHSSGGQLAGLAPSIHGVAAIALIAAGTADWRDYPTSQWPRLFTAWYVVLPALVAIFGYLPGWAGVGQHLPSGVARQWRRWGVTKGYLFGDPTVDSSGYRNYRGNVFAVSIDDDHDFAPPGPVSALLNQFASATREHQVVESGKDSVGHFGFFRPRHSVHWPVVTDWLARHTG